MIKHLVEEKGLSERKAGEIVSAQYPPEMNVTAHRARLVYRQRKGGSHDPVSKPPKKQTKPEVKIQHMVIILLPLTIPE